MEKKISKIKYLFKSGEATYFFKRRKRVRSLKKEVDNLSDEKFIELMYKARINRKLNLNNPVTLNEKIQWLKLNYRDELQKKCADKYRVREYINELGLNKYLVPLLGVYDKFSDIDFSILPNSFVIKVNNDCGGVYICREKNDESISECEKFINSDLLRENYSKFNKEWVYDDIPTKIIIEELIVSKNNKAPNDYKIFCFHGEPKFLFVGSNRDTDIRFDFFDTEWNRFKVINGHLNSRTLPQKPDRFDEMLSLARKLSARFPFVRVDLYNENNKIYFGELTFFHFSGMVRFTPKKYDYLFGRYLDLSKCVIDKSSILSN